MLAVLALILAALSPGIVQAEQPMDRIERLIEAGRTADADAAARRWLENNAGDRRARAVSALLAEAAWLTAAHDNDLARVQAWRAEFGASSPRAKEARDLEATLAWYAALKDPSEAGFRAIVDDYGGTAAAREANTAAGDQGLVEALAEATVSALGGWLSRYPAHAEVDTVRTTLDGLVWARAAAADTAAAWLDLRVTSPHHPRAREAREREALAALGALGSAPPVEDLMGHGVRYSATEAGRLAWRRALRAGQLLLGRVEARSWGRLDGWVAPLPVIDRLPLAEWPATPVAAPDGLLLVGVSLSAPLPRRATLELRAGDTVIRGAGAITDSGWEASFSLPVESGPAPLSLVVVVRDDVIDTRIGITLPAAPLVVATPADRSWLPEDLDCADPAEQIWMLSGWWDVCGDAHVRVEERGAFVVAGAAREAWSVRTGTEPTSARGHACPAPGFAPELATMVSPLLKGGEQDADGDDDDSAAPPDPPGDDDDSALEPAPATLPAWITAAPVAEQHRDLDGDGLPEGLFLVPRGGDQVIVVVDGTSPPLVTWMGHVDGAPSDSTMLDGLSHDGCRFLH